MSYLSLPTYIISQFGLFCISTHPTTFFSVLSNFLTSVVSCVTHSLGCEVVSRVSGSLSLFATCTLAFSIHLYAFSTVRLLPSPPPPPAKFICSLFVRRINRPVVCSQNCSSALSSVFRRWHFFFFDVWSILSFVAGFISFFFARMHIAHLFNQSSLNWCQPVIIGKF